MSNFQESRNQPAHLITDNSESDMFPQTARSGIKMGGPLIYIAPKDLQSYEPEDEEESNPHSDCSDSVRNLHHLNQMKEKSFTDKEIRSSGKKGKINTYKDIVVHKDPSLQAINGQKEKENKEKEIMVMEMKRGKVLMIYKKVKWRFVIILEVLIFLGFLIGSFPRPKALGYVDLGVNIICLFKIVLSHIWIYVYNRRREGQLSKNMEIGSGEASMQPVTLYRNTVEKYQFLQIISIILTPLCLGYQGQELIAPILSAIKVCRLFFPLMMNRKKNERLRINVCLHIIKLALFSGFFMLVISLILGFLLGNIGNYYCLSQEQMISITRHGEMPEQPLQQCGVSKKCSVDTDNGIACRNIFQYCSNEQDINRIREAMETADTLSSWDGSILNSFLATSGAGLDLYQKYEGLLLDPLIFVIVVILWLLGTLMAGVGVGETLRSETLEDWELNEKKCIEKMGNCMMKSRNSNISYNSLKNQIQQRNRQQVYKVDLSENSQSQEKPQSGQFLQEIARISGELSERPTINKILTVGFNLLSLLHVALVIVDDLQVNTKADNAINALLLLMLGMWLIGVIVAAIQYLKQDEADEIKRGILLYEGITVLVTLTDYISRIFESGYYLDRTSAFTPFSHALISLRVIYIMYNNGFSAYFSYYTEKMVSNFYNSIRFLSVLAMLPISLAFAQAHLSQLSFEETIAMINNSLGMVLGTGGGLQQGLASEVFFSGFKIIGFILGLYIAKHLNLGYDSILDMELSQEYPLSAEFPENPRETPSLGLFSKQNCLRDLCIKVHQLEYYHYIKIAIIIAYGIISLLSSPNERNTLSIILLCLDIYLLIDVVTQVIAYGLIGESSYLSRLPFFKALHGLSTVFLIIAFGVAEKIFAPVVVLLRVSKIWIIAVYIGKLREGIDTIERILLHPKLQIIRVYLLGIPLTILSMCLTARFSTASDGYTVVINAISFIYGLGWKFTGDEKGAPILVMNLMVIIVFLFFHVLCTFMVVTYFVNKRVREMGDIRDQVFFRFGSANPDKFDHISYEDRKLGCYISFVKIGILGVSLICSCILMGDSLALSQKRLPLAIFNLFLMFLEIMIFLLENKFVKNNRDQKWPWSEGIFMVLSVPGTFLLVAPTLKYSSGAAGLRVALHIFVMLSALRFLNIFTLITYRQLRPLTSRIFRRIFSQIPFLEFLCLGLLTILFLLPFSAAISTHTSSNAVEELLAFMTGGFFRNGASSFFDFAVKILTIVLVFQPLKIIMLGRIISSFLTNKPNSLTVLHEEICEVLSNNGIVDQDKKSFHLQYNNYYRLTKKLAQTFSKVSYFKIETDSYQKVEQIYKKLNLPVFLFHLTKTQRIYGVFVYDVILSLYYFSQKKKKNMDIDEQQSLYQLVKPKQEHVNRTPINSRTLAILVKSKNKMKSVINRGMRRRRKEEYEGVKKSRINSQIK